jgi:hypothetical protein
MKSDVGLFSWLAEICWLGMPLVLGAVCLTVAFPLSCRD